MTIQERISSTLVIKMNTKGDPEKINSLKFLKAELQRGKNKILSDEAALPILLKIIKDQNEMIKKLSTQDSFKKRTSEAIIAAVKLVDLTKTFVPNDIVIQLDLTPKDIAVWIEQNVDFSALKNPGQAIGVVKRKLPYVDGNLVKEAIQIYLARN